MRATAASSPRSSVGGIVVVGGACVVDGRGVGGRGVTVVGGVVVVVAVVGGAGGGEPALEVDASFVVVDPSGEVSSVQAPTSPLATSTAIASVVAGVLRRSIHP
jgi:hypothetical protein